MRRGFKLEKHRYLELQHWCLQYPEWKKKIRELRLTPSGSLIKPEKSKWIIKRGTEDSGVLLAELTSNCELLERVCHEASKELYSWLLLAVTKGISFNELKMLHGIPCERDMFYDHRRLFFWLLDKEK